MRCWRLFFTELTRRDGGGEVVDDAMDAGAGAGDDDEDDDEEEEDEEDEDEEDEE